jgi:hypothetical protein
MKSQSLPPETTSSSRTIPPGAFMTSPNSTANWESSDQIWELVGHDSHFNPNDTLLKEREGERKWEGGREGEREKGEVGEKGTRGIEVGGGEGRREDKRKSSCQSVRNIRGARLPCLLPFSVPHGISTVILCLA